MTIKHKIFSTITLVFAFITMTVLVSAQDAKNDDAVNAPTKRERKMNKMRGEGRHGRHGGKMMRGLHGLDLTETQKTQIKGIMESNKIANEPLRQELRTFFEKKRSGENLTDAEQNRIREIKTQMKQSMEQTHNTILALLTPEQRQQIEQQKLEREKRREERRERRQERKNQEPKVEINS